MNIVSWCSMEIICLNCKPMKFRVILPGILLLTFEVLILLGCNADFKGIVSDLGREPVIEPDYSGITIPVNIAPMNFLIKEDGSAFIIKATSSTGSGLTVRSSDGIVRFPEKVWRKLITGCQGGEIKIEVTADKKGKGSLRFKPFSIAVAKEPVDPFITYRILYPGYEAWFDMKIVQRSTGSFYEKSLFENQLLDNNCVNCHTLLQNDPDRFLLHVRGSKGGTYFADKEKVIKTSLKTKTMPANAVYPSWHPSGKYVAFSSNKTVQAFHSRPEKNIEVFDLFSSLVLYDIEKNEIMACVDSDTTQYMETFPYWSPDGSSLYYCRAPQVMEDFDFRDVKYDLLRISFDQENRTFGKPEVVFNAAAMNKSVSFPAVSPDGKRLVFTLHDYGTFSIWHKEADLYLLDLQDNQAVKMTINSDEAESYHSWSSNGKWLVFSSKRGDGLTAHPYFAYFGSKDQFGKPFVLPQKDPTLYERMLKTYNKPEFVMGKINLSSRDFERAAKNNALKAIWAGQKK